VSERDSQVRSEELISGPIVYGASPRPDDLTQQFDTTGLVREIEACAGSQLAVLPDQIERWRFDTAALHERFPRRDSQGPRSTVLIDKIGRFTAAAATPDEAVGHLGRDGGGAQVGPQRRQVVHRIGDGGPPGRAPMT
jgi:hypothetical protein